MDYEFKKNSNEFQMSKDSKRTVRTMSFLCFVFTGTVSSAEEQDELVSATALEVPQLPTFGDVLQ